MPRCYLLTAAQASALDQTTNTFSLFKLIEQVQLARPSKATKDSLDSLPFEVHCYWQFEPDELELDYEFKLLWVGTDKTWTKDQQFALKSDKRRQRVRIQGLPVPPTDGRFRIETAWRRVGEQEWNREQTFWPIDYNTHDKSG